jgi:CRISPR/Cas system-associated exonuclease Cas4 (RecB family)
MEIDHTKDKVVSFSQYSMYKSCPYKWYLQYVKGHKDETPNMHFVFGTAMHEALQHYLKIMFDTSAKKADDLK